MSKPKPAWRPCPVLRFRQERSLDRFELASLLTSAPGSLLPAITRLEAGLLDPRDPALARLWRWTQGAGMVDLLAETLAWWETVRPAPLSEPPAISMANARC